MRFAHSLVALGCLLALPAQAGEAPRSVIELFTSQGCSSCPPADRHAKELADEDKSLVLTLPVDYWDYLGWRDTLASPANSARQRAYSMARGDRKVFTPQIVVNGLESAIGSHRDVVEAAIGRAEGRGRLALPVEVEVKDGRVEVGIARAAGPLAERRAEVWAFAIERERPVEIGRGENAGRHVVYANVVRHMTRLGVWEGAPAKFDLPTEEVLTPGTDGVAILVQAGNGGQPGAILGAAKSERITPPPPAATAARMNPY